ncbi:hypothetical protein Tco_1456911 [Tanacetum coccineum]
MNMTLQSSIKDKILAAQEEASDELAEMQRGMDELMEHRSDGRVKRSYPTLEASLRGIASTCDFGEKVGDVYLPLIKDRLKAARDHQKIYADKKRKPLEFSVGEHVLLKVSPWKGMVHFGKKGKLAPRFIGPFEITERICHVAYRLRLPEELNGIHDTFHVSNLKKYLADPTLQIPLDEIWVDAKLNYNNP